MAFTAYVSRMTEYERGWGQRFDGYLVCLDKDGSYQWELENNNLPSAPDVYSKPSPPVAVMVEHVPYRMLSTLEDKRRVWVGRYGSGIRLMEGFDWP